MLIRGYKVFLSVLSGALLIFCFPKANLSFLAWFSFLPLFWAVHKKSPGESFFYSYLAGVVFFFGALYWVGYVSGLGFVLLVFYLAVYFGLFGLACSFALKLHPCLSLFFIPSFWVILEYLRSHLFTGFGWALLAHSQSRNLPLIQLSSITGAYGVSFLVMLVNVGIWRIIAANPAPARRGGVNFPPLAEGPARAGRDQGEGEHLVSRKNKLTRFITGLITFIFLAGVIIYGYSKLKRPEPEGSAIKIALIQASIPQELKNSRSGLSNLILDKHLVLTKLSAVKGEIGLSRPGEKIESGRRPVKSADLVVWPETAVPDYILDKQDLYAAIVEMVKETGIPLLTGLPYYQEEKDEYYNSAVLFSKEGIPGTRYDKLHLVPFGEYLPLRPLLSSLSNIIDRIDEIGDYNPGLEYTVFSLPGGARFSVLICFEDMVAGLSREFIKRGARLLINITNDAWFENSSAPYQHMDGSIFRAVENGVPLVRCANTGVSCFIDADGRVGKRVRDAEGRDVFITGYCADEVNLPERSGLTFYTRFGDLFCLLCGVIVAVMASLDKYIRIRYNIIKYGRIKKVLKNV